MRPANGFELLLADPVVPALNDLSAADRAQFLLDMTRLGDAMLKVTGAARINCEILGNSEPALHAHLFPRYLTEADEKRRMTAWFYDGENAVRFSDDAHGHLVRALREELQGPV